ncbi:MAG: hypothetical protein M3011_14005, partial [Actinomycetota bacterium]|nr:hypothetical protein [Actinomycetota bacterium]
MLRSLFGKTPSREEIERDATQQIESLARSGRNPPPAGWTLATSMSVAESPSVPRSRPEQPVIATDANLADDDPAEAGSAGADTVETVPAARPEAAVRPPRAAAKRSAGRARATTGSTGKPAATRRAPATRSTGSART